MARREFARFVIVGGIAALANIGARLVLSRWLPFGRAVLAAYLVGMAVAFLLARRYVFAASGQAAMRDGARFALVNAVAAGQVWVVSVGLAGWVFPALGFAWRTEMVAHAIGVGSPIVTSYFGHRYFSFARG